MHESLILWDVVEEHLDEAAFLVEMWTRACAAHDQTWRDVERAFGERLRAHLDALVIAGDAAAKRLLAPALADGDTERDRATACALALLASPGGAGLDATLRALADAEPDGALRSGIARALEVSDRPGLDDALRDALYAAEGDAQPALLSALSARCVDAGPIVATLLRSGDAATVTAAARAAALQGADALRGPITALLDARHEGVRLAAVETALLWGLREGWARCVFEAQRGDRDALAWTAMLGGPEALDLLRAAASRDASRVAALRALGCTGLVDGAAECLRWMRHQDKRVARVAADAFGAITGLDATAEGLSVKAPDDDELLDLDDDLATSLDAEVEDALPLPSPDAFARWFRENGARFDRGRRYLRGEALTAERAIEGLARGPMRPQRWLRWELRARSRGALAPGAPRLGALMRALSPDVAVRCALQQPVVWR
ncbi:MAG: TIGR02270 family protein [Polyangiales bacterium]